MNDKTLVLGDIHGRDIWRKIVDTEKNYNRIVFVGDYLDSYVDMTCDEELENLEHIMKLKLNPPDNVEIILLLGNHDFHYMPDYCRERYSRYRSHKGFIDFFEKYEDQFDVCIQVDKFLISHAGISNAWWVNNIFSDINYDNIPQSLSDLWKKTPYVFKQCGWERTGDSSGESPFWIRPNALIRDNEYSICKESNLIQIFGHTRSNEVLFIDRHSNLLGHFDNDECRYICVDCILNQYLVIEDGKAIQKNSHVITKE